MWATYCDDIRQEVGNKLSYLGVYGPNLIVPSFPTTLLKLCCAFSVRVPTDSPPTQVVFKLLRDEEVLLQHDVQVSDLVDPAVVASTEGNEGRVLTISTIAQLVSFPVTQHCFLKARAYVDGKELRGGALELLAAGTSTNAAA
jgi:hypothetical protein